MADSLSASPSNPFLRRISDFLRYVQEQDKPELLPAEISPFSLAAKFFLPQAKTVENLAYGNLPITMAPSGTGSRVPIVKTGRKEEVADILGFAMGGVPGGKIAADAVTTTGNKLSDVLVRGITGNAPPGTISLKELTRSPTTQLTERPAYVTKQEGEFYRVRPSGFEESALGHRGIREEVRPSAEELATTTTIRDQISPSSPAEEVAGLNLFNIAQDYNQRNFGSLFEEPKIPSSSLVKQSAIGRTFLLGAEESPQYKSAIFNAYEQTMPDVIQQAGAKNYDDLMEKAYRQLAVETDQQFRALPIQFSYHRGGVGDYLSSKEMIEDVRRNKHLYVFQGGDPHQFLNKVDPETGLNENEKFRAVHDALGHAIYGNEFGPKGEEIAWAVHQQMYSPLARLAMTAETRGQNSVVNYTPLNAELKASLAKLDELLYEAKRRGNKSDIEDIKKLRKEAFSTFQFAPQKGVLLPPEFLDPNFAGGMPSYVQPLISPAPGTTLESVLTHYGKIPGLTQTDPRMYGTGIKGEEMVRLADIPGAVRDRTYFYLGEPGAVSPEQGLGPNIYRASANRLYNIEQDPVKLGLLAREVNRVPYTAKFNQGLINQEQALADTERLIKEYGYQGYANPSRRAAAVFERMNVDPLMRFLTEPAGDPLEMFVGLQGK